MGDATGLGAIGTRYGGKLRHIIQESQMRAVGPSAISIREHLGTGSLGRAHQNDTNTRCRAMAGSDLKCEAECKSHVKDTIIECGHGEKTLLRACLYGGVPAFERFGDISAPTIAVALITVQG